MEEIDLDMPIAQILDLYPQLAEVLTYEYGLYCINCAIADFDTLREGAKIHQFSEDDLKQMKKHLDTLIQQGF